MAEVSNVTCIARYKTVNFIWLIGTVSIARQYNYDNSPRGHVNVNQHESRAIKGFVAAPIIKHLADQKTGSISHSYSHVSCMGKAAGKQNRSGLLLLTSLAPPDEYSHK